MPETPEYEANQGTPDALPKGGAKAANDALGAVAGATPEPTAAVESQPALSNPADLGYRTGPPREPTFRPQDEELAWAFAPAAEEPNYARMMPAGGRVPPPREVYAALPLLRRAATDPSAPEQVRNLYRVVAYHLGR